MQEIQTFFPQDLYVEHLSTIHNIHFTAREIDVIACLLSARRTSTTALFLSIDARTVETHISNIMSKIGCHTRESIIDFIEDSDKISLLRKYYSLLQVNALFEKSLKDIAKLIRGNDLRCFLLPRTDKAPLIAYLKSHLQLAGISVSSAARQTEGDYIIFAMPQNLKEEDASSLLQGVVQKANKILFLLQERKKQMEVPKEIKGFDVVFFAKHENYYLSFFTLLKKLLPNNSLDRVITEFKEKYKKIYTEAKLTVTSSKETEPKDGVVYQIKSHFILILFISVLFGIGFLAFLWSQGKESYFFRSDLIVPTESIFLNRAELINQIDEKLKRQGGIKTVALVGPGGAGKTTLARQYAHMQKAYSVWEINAETHESLNTSFEKLAQTLAKTEGDQGVLREIQEIKDLLKKEEKIIHFVKEHLKSKTNWLLIYDNVETFADIQKHFPQDFDTWGRGMIILTTRDSNIESNPHVSYAITLGELTPSQKLDLFQKVMTNGNTISFTVAQTEEAKYFLEKIPPFPLDILVAAYYLKTTNISYRKYLENLNKNENNFVNVQENILKESGDYSKTRYRIISLSLEQLINTHKDFQDLLLFISLLDSQNISRDLLNKYKNSAVVDSFIYNLKKYSLITNQTTFSAATSIFSIHRSTHTISLNYLTKLLNLESKNKYIQPIASFLEKYVVEALEKEDFSKIKFLIRHFEIFLNHNNLLNKLSKRIMGTAVGCMYYHLNDYEKARKALIESSLSLNKNNREDYIRMARSFLYLGLVERERGHPKIALNFLNQCLEIYEKFFSKISLETARVLTHSGIIYKDLGNIEKAKNLIEQSLRIYEEYAEDHVRMARPLMILGIIYLEKGQYEKAKSLIEKSLFLLYRKNSDNHLGIARALTYLAEANWKLGNYKKAKDLLEKSFLVYKKNVSENHASAGWALAILGSVHIDTGHYKKGINFIEKSLLIYKQHFAEDHAAIGWALASLSNAYKGLNNYEKAKNLIEHAILIFRKEYGDDNIWMFWALEKLGTIYKDLDDYKKAHSILRKCLSTYEKYYGKDHIETAQILRSMGQTYLLEGQLELSENFLFKALKIYKLKEHPESFLVLEEISKLHLKKSLKAANEGYFQKSQNFKKQAINYLKQTLELVKAHYSKDSAHLIRIQSELKNLEQ